MSAVPNATAQDLVKKALRKIGVLNRHDPEVPLQDLKDGLDAMWMMLDWFNSQNCMIPYVTDVQFDVNANQRIYTYGEGGDFDSPRPLNILAASWLDNAGSEWPINIVGTQLYVEGDPFKNTSQGRPYQLRWVQSYPTSQIQLEFFPQETDKLLLKVLLPFTAEICPCCDTSGCETGCVDPACEVLEGFL